MAVEVEKVRQISKKDLPMLVASGGNILMRHAGQLVEGKMIDYTVNVKVGTGSVMRTTPGEMSFTFHVVMHSLCAADVAKSRALAEEIVLISKELYDSVEDKK